MLYVDLDCRPIVGIRSGRWFCCSCVYCFRDRPKHLLQVRNVSIATLRHNTCSTSTRWSIVGYLSLQCWCGVQTVYSAQILPDNACRRRVSQCGVQRGETELWLFACVSWMTGVLLETPRYRNHVVNIHRTSDAKKSTDFDRISADALKSIETSTEIQTAASVVTPLFNFPRKKIPPIWSVFDFMPTAWWIALAYVNYASRKHCCQANVSVTVSFGFASSICDYCII